MQIKDSKDERKTEKAEVPHLQEHRPMPDLSSLTALPTNSTGSHVPQPGFTMESLGTIERIALE